MLNYDLKCVFAAFINSTRCNFEIYRINYLKSHQITIFVCTYVCMRVCMYARVYALTRAYNLLLNVHDRDENPMIRHTRPQYLSTINSPCCVFVSMLMIVCE